jgi:hypothetical protein
VKACRQPEVGEAPYAPVTASFPRPVLDELHRIAGDQGQRNEALARPLVREADD